MSVPSRPVVNLTPHSITVIMDDHKLEIPPSGTVARVSTDRVGMGHIETDIGPVRAYHQTLGEVTDLPEPEGSTCYIVSAMVAQAVPGRLDVVHPGELVRDESGRIIGCRDFVRASGYRRARPWILVAAPADGSYPIVKTTASEYSPLADDVESWRKLWAKGSQGWSWSETHDAYFAGDATCTVFYGQR